MELIESIVFSHEHPTFYDEEWDASITGNGKIKGYRTNNKVYIVGDSIFSSKRCSYMFAAKNSYGDLLWANLREIEGLSLLIFSDSSFGFAIITTFRTTANLCPTIATKPFIPSLARVFFT